MSNANGEYVVVYNVTLLDDIHNYFPALLYDQGQFQSVPHVFHYVRNQLNTRFNLFSYGASLYRGPSIRTVPISTIPVSLDPTPSTDGLSLLFSLLNNSIIPESPRAGQQRTRIVPTDAFIDPVIVRPSEAVITANTSVFVAESGQANCPICQDVIQEGEVCRKINICTHIFHRTCIDQWFRTNVRCPTCRHDVRITNNT